MIGSEQTSTAVEGEIDRLPFLCFRDVFHKLFHLFGFAAISTLVVDDFNGDGLLDIAATDGFSELVIFMPGNGDGTFGPGTGFGGGAMPRLPLTGPDSNPVSLSAQNSNSCAWFAT